MQTRRLLGAVALGLCFASAYGFWVRPSPRTVVFLPHPPPRASQSSHRRPSPPPQGKKVPEAPKMTPAEAHFTALGDKFKSFHKDPVNIALHFGVHPPLPLR